MIRTLGFIVILSIGLLVMLGCSQSSPLEPQPGPETVQANNIGSRVLWGYYRLGIDLSIPAVEVIPLRQAMIHKNVKQYVSPPACTDCITITPTGPYSGNILPLDITLKNPTALTGYDVRGILISDDEGATLSNPDNHTKLFDNGGPIDINPFKAFAKSETDRAFGPGISHTEHYDLYLSGFGKVAIIDYAVDANWPSRAKEPYLVASPFVLGGLDDLGLTEATFSTEVYAAGEDVDEVLADFSSLGFTEEFEMSFVSGDMWEITITNENLQAEGDYECWIRASTSSSNKYLYSTFSTHVVVGIPPFSLANDVQPILDANCISCHMSTSPPLDLDLTSGNTYDNIVDVPAVQSGLDLVEPGLGIHSYVVGKILGIHLMWPFDGSGDQMPKGGGPLGDEDIGVIIKWVDSGALDN